MKRWCDWRGVLSIHQSLSAVLHPRRLNHPAVLGRGAGVRTAVRLKPPPSGRGGSASKHRRPRAQPRPRKGPGPGPPEDGTERRLLFDVVPVEQIEAERAARAAAVQRAQDARDAAEWELWKQRELAVRPARSQDAEVWARAQAGLEQARLVRRRDAEHGAATRIQARQRGRRVRETRQQPGAALAATGTAAAAAAAETRELRRLASAALRGVTPAGLHALATLAGSRGDDDDDTPPPRWAEQADGVCAATLALLGQWPSSDAAAQTAKVARRRPVEQLLTSLGWAPTTRPEEEEGWWSSDAGAELGWEGARARLSEAVLGVCEGLGGGERGWRLSLPLRQHLDMAERELMPCVDEASGHLRRLQMEGARGDAAAAAATVTALGRGVLFVLAHAGSTGERVRHTAATRIQARQRGCRARRRLVTARQRRAVDDFLATKLQARVRGKQGRKLAEDVRQGNLYLQKLDLSYIACCVDVAELEGIVALMQLEGMTVLQDAGNVRLHHLRGLVSSTPAPSEQDEPVATVETLLDTSESTRMQPQMDALQAGPEAVEAAEAERTAVAAEAKTEAEESRKAAAESAVVAETVAAEKEKERQQPLERQELQEPAAGGAAFTPWPLVVTTSEDLTQDSRFDVIINPVTPEWSSRCEDTGVNHHVWRLLSGTSAALPRSAPPVRYNMHDFIAAQGAPPTYGDVLLSRAASVATDSGATRPASPGPSWLVHALAPMRADAAAAPVDDDRATAGTWPSSSTERLATGLSHSQVQAAWVALFFRAFWRAEWAAGPDASIGLPPFTESCATGGYGAANDPSDVQAACALAYRAYAASGGSARVFVVLGGPWEQQTGVRQLFKWCKAANTTCAPTTHVQLARELSQVLSSAAGELLLAHIPAARTREQLTALRGDAECTPVSGQDEQEGGNKQRSPLVQQLAVTHVWCPCHGAHAVHHLGNRPPFTYPSWPAMAAAVQRGDAETEASTGLLQWMRSPEFLHFSQSMPPARPVLGHHSEAQPANADVVADVAAYRQLGIAARMRLRRFPRQVRVFCAEGLPARPSDSKLRLRLTLDGTSLGELGTEAGGLLAASSNPVIDLALIFSCPSAGGTLGVALECEARVGGATVITQLGTCSVDITSEHVRTWFDPKRVPLEPHSGVGKANTGSLTLSVRRLSHDTIAH